MQTQTQETYTSWSKIGGQLCTLHAEYIAQQVRIALMEDVGTGDITGLLVDAQASSRASIISREALCVCGQAWVNEVFAQLNVQHPHLAPVHIDWQTQDGVYHNQASTLCKLEGSSRLLLTGERTALNFLQTLSATATHSHRLQTMVRAIGTQTKILDTRKTIPQLRLAQKYAVACGGGYNHRLGLYDAFLIKENHIAASASIASIVARAKAMNAADDAHFRSIEIEVENLDEFAQAMVAQVDIIMLDNFSIDDVKQALALRHVHIQNGNQAPAIEISGNIENEEQLNVLLTLGVDFISTGALTKHVRAIDLSMRIEN